MIGKLLLLTIAATPVMAETRVSLIGGGDTPEHSQAQIESNVGWLQAMFGERAIETRTYFGSGNDGEPDVTYLVPTELASTVTQALPAEPRVRARPHELPDIVGSTRKPELTASLRRDLASLPPGDDALVIFNGHGGIDRADTRNNYLKLWGDGRMTVSDLESLLDAAPEGAQVRFVMAQCYSGAFARLIYDEPRTASGFRGNRCGFMSEAADRLAEGCSLSLDEAEFRDYTTYFFAALAGRTRSGEPIEPHAVDRDGDGAVSFRESHFYALLNAHSSDLSRSTSEQYLEDWSPWYLRWDSIADGRGSVYWSLAEELAQRYGWQTRPAALAALRGQYSRAAERAAPGRESRDATRMLTQVEKIYRLRQLARLEQALERYGDAEDRGRYGQLVQCEAGHVTP